MRGKSTASAAFWYPAADLEVTSLPLKSILHPAASYDEASNSLLCLIKCHQLAYGHSEQRGVGKETTSQETWLIAVCLFLHNRTLWGGRRAVMVCQQTTPFEHFWKYFCWRAQERIVRGRSAVIHSKSCLYMNGCFSLAIAWLHLPLGRGKLRSQDQVSLPI